MIISIEEAIERIRLGRMIILVDDEDRENEGDLVMAAEKVTPEAINFMATHGRGLICLALSTELADRLSLEPMSENNTATFGTAFTVSIDAAAGITTGISARDRAATILKVVVDGASKSDFVIPGHVFPLRARNGGVLVRSGQTEGSTDLARFAGLKPAAIICEVLHDDGTMKRMLALIEFGKEYDIPVVTIADLIEFRLKHESLIELVAKAKLPTEYGLFEVFGFSTEIDPRVHIALKMGELLPNDHVPVRVHGACFLNDIFDLNLKKGRPEIDFALKYISQQRKGIFLHLHREERGEDVVKMIHEFTENGNIANPMEKIIKDDSIMTFRDYGIGAQILQYFGLKKVRVITNNPRKLAALQGYGIQIMEYIPIK